MADKDLLVVISEMLRKQDHHSEILNKQTEILSKQSGMLQDHTGLLEKHGEVLVTMSKSLTTLVDISSEQFGQQQKFNKDFLKKLEGQKGSVDHRLENIENLLGKALNMEDRVKRLETAVFK